MDSQKQDTTCPKLSGAVHFFLPQTYARLTGDILLELAQGIIVFRLVRLLFNPSLYDRKQEIVSRGSLSL